MPDRRIIAGPKSAVVLHDASGNAISAANPLPSTTTVNTVGKTLLCIAGSMSGNGNNTLIAAPATGAIYVYGYALQATGGAVNAKLQDGAGGTDLTCLWNFDVKDGVSRQVTPPGYLFRCSAGTLLNLSLSAALACQYEINYWVE